MPDGQPQVEADATSVTLVSRERKIDRTQELQIKPTKNGVNSLLYRLMADLILVIHGVFVLFVVAGLLLILAGKVRGWAWVRGPWFRSLHLLAIGIVVVQAWLGQMCPLTFVEQWLRARAGDVSYEGAFIAHWIGRMLYYEAPLQVFAVGYTLFGLLVVAAWFRVRPRRFREK